VVLVDERASSIEAAQRFAADRAEGRRRRRDAAALDAVAAAVIVERWLAAPQDAVPVPATPTPTKTPPPARPA
jgi:putative Holliday junction resolvase